MGGGKSVDPYDQPPDGAPDRNVTIRLTRETLILIAGLVLLGLAILLVVIFPGANKNASTGTSVAGPTGTTNPSSIAAFPTGSVTAEASASSTAASTTFTPIATTRGPVGTGYPAPGPTTTGGYPVPFATIVEPTTRSTGTAATAPAGQGTGSVTAEVDQGTPGLLASSTETPSSIASGTTSPQRTGLPTFGPTRTSSEGTPSAQGSYPPPGGTQITETPNVAATQTALADESVFGGSPTSTVVRPSPEVAPTSTIPSFPQPTQPPQPTSILPTRLPQPTPGPRPTSTALPPTPIPETLLTGAIRWTQAQSPIVLTQNTRLAPGASLIIDPGVDVQMAPGVDFTIQGALFALGQPGQPVRFLSMGGLRWDSIYGRPGSAITMEYTEVRGGGNGGTTMQIDGSTLAIRHSHITDNGGHLQVNNSQVEVSNT